ncbi:MAG: hypothetical protein JJ957_16150 [Pseudomonadales bacterium]|nr:hypothetical protein [Pseudomonadales bacterium]MBO6597809.1 hypothetical protein [Pseudomonadales bacterium]MBO6824047.1 hypothetical protein [Pseudomonadales bacterium]
MESKYSFVLIPNDPKPNNTSFGLSIVTNLAFSNNDNLDAAGLQSLLESHPLLSLAANGQSLKCQLAEFTNPGVFSDYELVYEGGPFDVSEMQSNLKNYYGVGDGAEPLLLAAQSAESLPIDNSYDRLTAENFFDSSRAHDELEESFEYFNTLLGENFRSSSIRDFSSVNAKWRNASVQKEFLKVLSLDDNELQRYSNQLNNFFQNAEIFSNPNEKTESFKNAAAIYSTARFTTLIRSMRAQMIKLETKYQQNLDAGNVPEECTLVDANDTKVDETNLNFKWMTALKEPLLNEATGMVTRWRLQRDNNFENKKYGVRLASTQPDVPADLIAPDDKPTWFSFGPTVFPASHRNRANGLLVSLDDFNAKSIAPDNELLKRTVLQLENSTAPLTGDVNCTPKDKVDRRPPQDLEQEQFGIGEPTSSGVVFSASVDELITHAKGQNVPDGYFHEDLAIGYRIDISRDTRGQGTPFFSLHEHEKTVSLTLSGTEISIDDANNLSVVEDYIEKEQAHSYLKTRGKQADEIHSTELFAWKGMGTMQAKTFSEAIGGLEDESYAVDLENPQFKVTSTRQRDTIRLTYGDYRYRVRSVFQGGVGVSRTEADALALVEPYIQRFPFYRHEAFSPGEIVHSTQNLNNDWETDKKDKRVRGQDTIYFLDDDEKATITLVPTPIDLDVARYRGIAGNSGDPINLRGIRLIKDVAELSKDRKNKALSYFLDDAVPGFIVSSRLLNGVLEEDDDRKGKVKQDFAYQDRYCRLTPHQQLEDLILTYGRKGSWRSFKPIELNFAATSRTDAAVRPSKRRPEVIVPPGGVVEVELKPDVELKDAVKTAINFSGNQALTQVRATLAFSEPVIETKKITVIHAVKQPLKKPYLQNASSPGEPALLSKSSPGTEVRFDGTAEIDAATTGGLLLRAEWRDLKDQPEQPELYFEKGFSESTSYSPVFEPHKLDSPSFDALLRMHGTREVTSSYSELPLQKVSSTQCAEDRVFYGDANLTKNCADTEIHPGSFELNDQRRKRGSIQAIAVSRYRDLYQAEDENLFRRYSRAIDFEAPSSVSLSAPQISHVVPIIRQVEKVQSGRNIKQKLYGLRVYVKRPWFESGIGERLALGFGDTEVVGDDFQINQSVTQWGEDPVALADQVLTKRRPRASDFEVPDSRIVLDEQLYPETGFDDHKPVIYRDDVSLAGGEKLDVASYALRFDANQKLWFCDVVTTRLFHGWCGLAFYRHQPNSLDGLHLSQASAWVYANFVYDAPVVYYSSGDSLVIKVGPCYESNSPKIKTQYLARRRTTDSNVVSNDSDMVPLRSYRVGNATYHEVRVVPSNWLLLKSISSKDGKPSFVSSIEVHR